MIRYLIKLVVVLLPFCLNGQAITNGEYFFNNDPGTGSGMTINVSTPDAVVDLDLNIDLPDQLPDGFNTIYFRFKDDQQLWSHTYSRVFFKKAIENTSEPIDYVEYFIDDDPGKGAGISVPVGNVAVNVSLDFEADLSGLSEGFHQLYTRARTSDGRWGLTTRRIFYLKATEDTRLINLLGIKYYFINDNFASDTFSILASTPQPSLEFDFEADISSLPPDQFYDMYILAFNEEGRESIVEKRTIKACSEQPTIANFGFISFGNNVSFIDSSSFTTQYLWDFGDGTTDTVSNPVHEYSELGVYETRLITSNFCKSDTLIKEVSIAGLTGLSTAAGGNYGDVSLEVYGGGFNANANLYLSDGNTIINPDTFILVDQNIAFLRFDLRDEPLGVYDVVFRQQSSRDTLHSSFTIFADAGEPRFSLDITGRTAVRRGRSSPLTFSYTNHSPVDAIGVPLIIIIRGDTTIKVDFDFEFIKPDENDGIAYEEVSPFFNVDSLYGKKEEAIIIPLMIPYMLAGQMDELVLQIEAENDFEVDAWLGDSFYNSPIGDNIVSCVQGLVGIASSLLTTNPITGCATNIIDNGFSIFGTLHAGGDGILAGAKKYGSLAWSLTKIIAGCTTEFIPVAKLAKISYKAIRIFLAIGTAGAEVETLYNISKCPEVFFGSHETKLNRKIRVVNSFDPNEKTGPLNSTADNYVRSSEVFDYTIYFENLSTASAAAQEVFISDTLDASLLNLHSFALGPIAFGDNYEIVPPPGLTEYSVLLDLQPALDLVLRVDASLDTMSGIASWRFLSLDPQSLELTDDPFLGFLPPNVTAGEGEGSVSFSIQPKTGLPTGTPIENKAAIVFDVNEPIITNTHLNTIDDIAPQSAVSSLSAVVSDSVFTVDWSGSDADAGIRAYNIYVSVNSGPFELWLYDISDMQAHFTGVPDSTYGFFSIAKDYAGNVEAEKSMAEATTLITSLAEPERGLKAADCTIFPNPSIGRFTIAFSTQAFGPYGLSIYNTIGQLMVEEVKIGAVRHSLDLSALPKGLYLLKMNTQSGIIYKEVVLY